MSSSEAVEQPSSPSEASIPEPITFSVKSSNDTKYTVSLPPITPVTELKNKLAELSGVPADRQRLIYSGRVMKDEETLATYKIQSGHTVHMVKGAASNVTRGASAGGPASSANARPAVPTNIAAGSGNNPLAGLTGARYAGHVQLPSADMFGPDGGVSLECPFFFLFSFAFLRLLGAYNTTLPFVIVTNCEFHDLDGPSS